MLTQKTFTLVNNVLQWLLHNVLTKVVQLESTIVHSMANLNLNNLLNNWLQIVFQWGLKT